MKDSRVFGGFARVVSHHPRTVLGLLAMLSLVFAVSIPRLTADPSPRALLASADPEQEEVEAEARRTFGSTDNVIVLLIGAKNVLEKGPLSYAHELTLWLQKQKSVERVDSLTRLTFPKAVEEELGLDDLGAEPEDTASPEQMGAAADLVAAAPDVFPMGLATLAEKTAGKKFEPLVPGDKVEDADVVAVNAAVAQAAQLSGRLVSRNKHHLVLAISLADELVKHEQVEGVVRAIEDQLVKVPPPAGVTADLSGLPVVRTSLVRHMRADQRVLIPGTLIASFIVLALSFRWAPAVLLPIVAVGITALWLLGGMALFGEPLNVLNNMLPALVIIIGLNEAVHIIGRYMEEHERSHDKLAALQETVRAMGAACLMTTLTSAVGLAALVVSRTEMLRRFGMVGAIGLLLAYAVTLLVVPAVLSLLKGPPKPDDDVDERGRIETAMARVTTAAMRNPWWVVGVSAATAIAAGFLSQRVVVDSTLLDQFSQKDPIYLSTHVLETEFEGVRPLELNLSSDVPGRFYDPEVLRAVHRIASWTEKQRGVLRVTDPTEPLVGGWAALTGQKPDVKDALRTQTQVKALATLLRDRDPRILKPYVTADGETARVRIKLSDIGSRGTGRLVEQLHTQVERELGQFKDVKSGFGGDAYVSSRGLDAVVADLSGSVTVAALIVLILLAVLLRDVRLALLAIPANLIPQAWTMAWMVLRGIPLNASSAIIFSLSIGLSVDGSIHLVSRFQEERARGALVTVALVRAVRGTGRNIVVSSVALVLGFSVMLLSNFVPVQRFAELITVSLAGCVVATLVLQPVLLRLFAARSPAKVSTPKSTQ